MAAGLMFGLAFAVVLCLIVTPVLYAIFFGIHGNDVPASEALLTQKAAEAKTQESS